MAAHSLEQEAMERVRRMYAPYDRDSSPNRSTNHEPVRVPNVEPKKEETREPESEKDKPNVQAASGGMLELLMKDKDRSLIMLLLVIMLKDGADMNLILALVYLLI